MKTSGGKMTDIEKGAKRGGKEQEGEGGEEAGGAEDHSERSCFYSLSFLVRPKTC